MTYKKRVLTFEDSDFLKMAENNAIKILFVMSKVLVGFDFSTGSANAVDVAIDIANRFQQDLRSVYVKENWKLGSWMENWPGTRLCMGS